MAIKESDKRDLLLESGGNCLFCPSKLIVDDTNISEFAHIISQKPDGPRGNHPNRQNINIDGKENIVVLCPTCHTKIDKNHANFSVESITNYKEARKLSVIKGNYQSEFDDTLDRVRFIFDFWAKSININSFFYNANYIPFSLYDLRIKLDFIRLLESYLSKIKLYLNHFPNGSSFFEIKRAIQNFNCIVIDFLDNFFEYECKQDLQNDLYIYWVDVDNIPYDERSKLVQYKKIVLKSLLFNMIKASNYILQLVNNSPKIKKGIIPYVEFIRDWAYNGGTISPEEFPIYSPEELNEVGLYQGINALKDFWYQRVYEG